MQTIKTLPLIWTITIELKTVVGSMNTCFSKYKWQDKSSWHYALRKVSVIQLSVNGSCLGRYFCNNEKFNWLQIGKIQQMTKNLHNRHGNTPMVSIVWWLMRLNLTSTISGLWFLTVLCFFHYETMSILAESNAIRISSFHHDALSWQSKSASRV